MLTEFITHHTDEIIRRCRAKARARQEESSTPGPIGDGISRFLAQLVAVLEEDGEASDVLDADAADHGRWRSTQDGSIAQVVHDYGDVCQAITDLAVDMGVAIDTDEFRTLNRCLDDAIAHAVTEYERERTLALLANESAREDERFGFLAHEVRNLLSTATIAFEVIRTGSVGVGGSTGRVLTRSLASLRDVIDRSMAEVRIRHARQVHVRLDVRDLVTDVTGGARLQATRSGLRLDVEAGDPGVVVEGDSAVLAAVLTNLVQNALKFTRPETTVQVVVVTTADRVRIDVADACGGLPAGDSDALFLPFRQRGVDRSGLGLGLAFSRWGAEAHEGQVSVRDVEGHGCVFSLELPRAATSV